MKPTSKPQNRPDPQADPPDPKSVAEASGEASGEATGEATGEPSAAATGDGSLTRHSPFGFGFFAAIGALIAIWLMDRIVAVGPILILIVVAFFIAAGLNPAVEFFERRRMKRHWAVLIVLIAVVIVVVLFITAIVPVISDQIAQITRNAPTWLSQLQENRTVQRWNNEYDIINKIEDYIAQGDLAGNVFGGVLGFGKAVLSLLGNAFIVLVLSLYFLASLRQTKAAFYKLAPGSKRDRVSTLSDRIVSNIGGYVSGAFMVALCAGVSSLVILMIVGMGEYAIALAFTVAVLDVIPMIGATLGAVVVCAIGFATDVRAGIILLIFFLVYQQIENYVIYPKVMARSVDVPGSVTVIAALVGASLLGVVGALLAIPTAAAILLIAKEVIIPRQDQR